MIRIEAMYLPANVGFCRCVVSLSLSLEGICLGRLGDERFSAQVDIFALVVRLAASAHQCMFPPGQAMLRDYRIMDMPAIHAAVPGRPHVPGGALEVQEMILYHETAAA
jgi:hypothetical protein